MSDDIAKLAAGIPVLAGFTGQAERLGGLTNRVYRLGHHILRVPGEGTAAYINRAHEAEAAHEAARVGVSPAVLHADPATGLMVTQFIDHAATMSPAVFRSRPGAVARAARVLRQIHRSDARFPVRFDLFAMVDDYLRILSTRAVALPTGYQDFAPHVATLRATLATPVPLVASHCDPLCENFLDTGDRMWLVDWEYSGMNDPMWDLGDLSVEAEFDPVQDQTLLTAYFDGPPPAADHGRMVIYKAMCDYLWTLWGLIQLANQNPADDFRAYADGRFARCKALFESDAFAAHVAAASG
ncbi:MAG: choline/ethanolamine kinase family protein [bacterium]